MRIKIEDFIEENRKAFDTDAPSSKLWEKIEQELDKKNKKKTVNIQLWIGVAASLVVLLSFTFFYLFPAKRNRLNVADVNPAYGDTQVKFASLIEQKRDSLEIYAPSNPKLYQKFSRDLQKLNIDYEGLRKELPSSPNQQLVVKAMMRNLETQLQLVSQQLSIITEVSQYKKENRI
ncbi:hypothetical protein [Pedobacter sp. L105]|uniref:hypothetical protein n=1 Tax=Pedobacter sp. L105 TaxID=1641871 RepID=UPI00131D1BB3|nr:hypothetical protein [Pedobacter sp. L105]